MIINNQKGFEVSFKSLQPTRDGAVSSAVADGAFRSRVAELVRSVKTMKAIIALLLMALCVPLIAQDLKLTVVPPKEPIHVGDYPRFAATITNSGTNAVALVYPGDGSDCGWRTPVVGWSILPAGSKTRKHPETPPLFKGTRCGNINSLRLAEVFSLKAGESRRFDDWLGDPVFEESGKFRIVFYYQNIPDLKIIGVTLKPHEDGVLDRFKQSTPCRIVSEEIVVDVLPKKP